MLLHRCFTKAKKERGCTFKERISETLLCTAGKKSFIYRGVTRDAESSGIIDCSDSYFVADHVSLRQELNVLSYIAVADADVYCFLNF
uniref:Uncharacterized protein n=1 Tax=Brassica oleracea var. oleracea TaxID=109376 RepID=A0A0D3E5M6_BRAOL